MKKLLCIMLGLLSIVCLVGCKNQKANIELPKQIELTTDKTEPKLKLYNTATKEIEEINFEDYIAGVVAGEINNDWNPEAIKAQAVVARTFAIYFLQNNKSKYDGADISSDITEAQAYAPNRINDNIRSAVAETKGKVVTSDGKIVETYFHSNSGGKTTESKYGLNNFNDESYTKSVDSPENEENSKDFTWTAKFSKADVLSALRKMGASVSSVKDMTITSTDKSGRAQTIKFGDTEVNANDFRLKIGSTKLKSTLIDDITMSTSSIVISGKGYGHGVGMSQWGAQVLAENGKTYDEILKYYFRNIEIKEAKYHASENDN